MAAFMACSNPRTAYLTTEGKVTFSTKGADISRPVYLPCRKCELCLRARKLDITTRLVAEGYSHPESICATFTYAPEHVPEGGGLSKRDAQLVVKRVREYLDRCDGGRRTRAHVVGEYSPKLMRPHYHAIFFNWWPADALPCGKSQAGRPEFCSAILSDLWGKGRVTFQRFDAAAAGYVAKHQASKLRRKGAAELAVRNPDGTWRYLPPEFELRPLRPGLGAGFFEKYSDQLLAHDFTVLEGRKVPLPQYFDTLAQRLDPGRLSDLKAERALRAADPKQVANSTRERLAVREEVAQAKAAFFSQAGGVDVPY